MLSLLGRAVGAIVLVYGALVGVPAGAATVSFLNITNNNAVDVAGQLSVEVADAGSGAVGFTFKNSVSPYAASITDVYFDYTGLFSGISSISSSAGVSFSEGAAPPDLPGGDTITPVFSAELAADSNSPGIPANGVNSPGEWLLIVLGLTGGNTFGDVLASLMTGDFRIGMHVQAIGTGGGSDSFVSTVAPVPLPAAVWLFGSALAGLGAMRLRRRRQTA